MAVALPDAPEIIGEIWTNPHTGVDYEWNGERWVTVKSNFDHVAYTDRDQTFTEINTFNKNVILPEIPTENTHGTNKFYTDAQDTILHGMVDVIVGRKVYAKYQLQKDDRSIRSGKFKLLLMPQHDSNITQANDWEDVNYIYFAYDDYDGHRRALTEFKVGDQLSIESENGAATFIINQVNYMKIRKL